MIIVEYLTALLFILSSGILYGTKFKNNPYLVAAAGALAVLSMIFFLSELAPGTAKWVRNAKEWLIAQISGISWSITVISPRTTPSNGTPVFPSRDSFRDCEHCPDLVRIPAGSFKIGSPRNEPGHQSDEEPQTDISIEKPFLIGQYKVTFAQWDACADAGGCQHKPSDADWGRGDRPVLNVSWDDAQEYLSWLRKVTKKRYRLPSEAEWEYAARAGSQEAYSWGAEVSPSQANYKNYLQKTVPVSMYAKNKFGLYQVHGNLGEWMQDCWHNSYAHIPRDGSPYRPGDCAQHAVRGGHYSFVPERIRAASRGAGDRDARTKFFGFRVACDLDPQ